MSNEEYQILEIMTGRTSIPRALVLVITNGKPTAIYELDVYGYECPDTMDLPSMPKGDYTKGDKPLDTKEETTHE